MKIEIMDLLHKIYNLDDMPGKIIFDNCVWRYCSEFQDYQSERGYLFGDYMTHINETRKFLNGEVEIVEEHYEETVVSTNKRKTLLGRLKGV